MTEFENKMNENYEIKCDAIQRVAERMTNYSPKDIDRVLDYTKVIDDARKKQAAQSVLVEKSKLFSFYSELMEIRTELMQLQTSLNIVLDFFLDDIEEGEKTEFINSFNKSRNMLSIALGCVERGRISGNKLFDIMSNIIKESEM